MLKNLRKALDEKSISIKAYAAFLGVSEKTAWNKLQGATDFSYPEAAKTNKELLPEYSLTYLFASEDDADRERSMR